MHSSYPKFFLNLYNRINLKQQQETIFRKKQGATLKKSINYNEQNKTRFSFPRQKRKLFSKKKTFKNQTKNFSNKQELFLSKNQETLLKNKKFF